MTCRSAHFTIDLGAHPARNVLFLVHKGYVDSGRLIGDPGTVPIVDETSRFHQQPLYLRRRHYERVFRRGDGLLHVAFGVCRTQERGFELRGW